MIPFPFPLLLRRAAESSLPLTGHFPALNPTQQFFTRERAVYQDECEIDIAIPVPHVRVCPVALRAEAQTTSAEFVKDTPRSPHYSFFSRRHTHFFFAEGRAARMGNPAVFLICSHLKPDAKVYVDRKEDDGRGHNSGRCTLVPHFIPRDSTR